MTLVAAWELSGCMWLYCRVLEAGLQGKVRECPVGKDGQITKVAL